MPNPLAVNLLDVLAFVQVVETGSIANAANRLDIAKSIVSRRVSRLESVLGARLLTRTPRGSTLTDIGLDYHARASAGLAELEAAQEVVTKATAEISGHLRIQAPVAFGEYCLAPLLAEFAVQHPNVQLDVRFEDRQVDMVREAYDLAVWTGDMPDSVLITRKLARVRWIVVASPAYLDAKGRPSEPSELSGHDVILYLHDTGRWRFRSTGDWEAVRVDTRFRADNGQMLLAAAKAGLGIVLVPRFMVEDILSDGELEAVLPEYTHEGADLQLFLPAARSGIARVRALVNFLTAHIEREI